VQQQPDRRSQGIYVEWIGEECVVYDRVSHVAHSLSAAAAQVWESCDGQRSPDQIAAELQLAPALVQQALAELNDCGLLDAASVEPAQFTRRQVSKRLGIVGGMAFAAPLIYSVTVGVAGAAASTLSCSEISCSANDSTSDAAQSDANAQCSSAPECQATSTCNCVPDSSSGDWECSYDTDGNPSVCVY
jgi:hypothetical protein